MEKDYKSIEGQLDFVAYELRNAHQDIGMALRRAKTVDEARSAAEPYVTALREDSVPTKVGSDERAQVGPVS